LKAILIIVFALVGGIALTLFYFTQMPGKSPPASTARLTEEQKDASERMKETCETLAHQIGQRSTAKAANVLAAKEFLMGRLRKMGLRPAEKSFATRGYSGTNIEARVEGAGSRSEILVLGAHYDTEAYSPGAGDNASGCAMLLEIAHELAARPRDRTIEIVFFDFGSARFAGTDDAGAKFWVEDARRSGKRIAAMLAFDCVGTFKDAPKSQTGPFPLNLCYPSQGNFLLFAGDIGARKLVQACVSTMRANGGFPVEGITLPGVVPGISKSDHYAFRQNGWPAIVVTDTGPFRNPDDGQPSDTPDRLNYDRMAVAWTELVKLVEKLAQAGTPGVSSLN